MICPLCNSENTEFSVGTNTSFGRKNDISFCLDCGLYFFSKMPSVEELHQYYSTMYFQEIVSYRFSYFLKTYFSKIRAISQKKFIEKFLPEDAQKVVIECGSADGTLLSLFRLDNWEVDGFEPNEAMRSKALQRHNLTLKSEDFLITKTTHKASLVAFPHILEHVPDPVLYLKKAGALIGKHGLIFIEFPMSPLPGLVTSDVLNSYFGTTHLYDFTESSTKKLLEKSGLKLVHIQRYKYPTPYCDVDEEKKIGQALLTGSVSDLTVTERLKLSAALMKMHWNRNSEIGGLESFPAGTSWRGRGDNIRVLARV